MDFILAWATKEKFFSRYFLLIFLTITLLSGPDNLASMIEVLKGTEVIGFVFDISFIKIFVWLIIIAIAIESYLALRGYKKIDSNFSSLKTEMNQLDISQQEEFINKFKKTDSKMQAKVLKLLNILIFIISETIFMMILNEFKSADTYILAALILLVIVFLIFSIFYLSIFKNINFINKEIKKWDSSHLN